nr:hypothetical protein [uncultured Draconibacterium sp.]
MYELSRIQKFTKFTLQAAGNPTEIRDTGTQTKQDSHAKPNNKAITHNISFIFFISVEISSTMILA